MTKPLLIITGGSKGIGRATTHKYQQAGWHIVNISRSPCEFADLNIKADLSAAGWQDAVMAALAGELAQARPISLVHNAAFLVHDSVSDVNSEVLTDSLQLGVVAPSVLNTLLIPFMTEPSSIIYIGSTLSEQATAGAYTYVVGKHASVGMMRATCQDLFGKPIHTACVCPGFTETEMVINHVGKQEEVLSAIRAMVSENRFIQPAEIADLIYYAATHSVLNGSVLHANLGQKAP